MYYTFTNGKNINLITSWDSSCGNPKDVWELKFTAESDKLDEQGFVFNADVLTRLLEHLKPPAGYGWKGSCEQLLGGFTEAFLALEGNLANIFKLTATMSVVGQAKTTSIELSQGDIKHRRPEQMAYGPLERPKRSRQ